MSPLPRLIALLALGACLGDPVGAVEPACLADGSGRLDLVATGALEVRAAWSGDGFECQGMPRPDGGGLRLMFANRAEALLVVIGVSGIGRGETGRGLPANFTLVREGEAEFYSTLGDDICRVDILESTPLPAPGEDLFRVRGEGECADPVPAVAREGQLRVRPFAFTGVVLWPPETRSP